MEIYIVKKWESTLNDFGPPDTSTQIEKCFLNYNKALQYSRAKNLDYGSLGTRREYYVEVWKVEE